MSRHTRSQIYRYVRKVQGQKFQARVWLGDHLGMLNLGLYYEEREAWEAAKRFINRNEIPDHILPKYVRRAAGGNGFVARVKKRGLILVLGPFPTPSEAHQAMVTLLAKTFPGVPAHERTQTSRSNS